MNKNWLYRVLAMALIVMMALPFAMAEEVEVQTNAVEEAVVSEDFDIGGTTEAVEVTEVAANAEWDVETIEWSELEDLGEWDIADSGDTVYVQLDEEDADEYKITSYKSSKTKYAKISKVDKEKGVFKITFKDPGKTKFTVKYKYREEDEDHWDHSGTATAEIEVKDSNTIDNVYLFFGDGEDLTSKDDRIDENPFEVKFGKYSDVSVIPFAVNEDGDVMDYNQGEDVVLEEEEENSSSKRASNWDKYTFKWSNTSVACFEDANGKKVNNKTWTTEEISELTPVFYKPGKSKLTVTSKYDKKKKCTVTFKVTGFDALPTGKKPSAPADTVYFRVKSAKYTSYKEAEVVLYIVNGGKAKLHKSPVDVAIVDEKGTTVFAKDGVSFPTLAGGKSTTLKITFKSDDKHDEIQEYQDLRYLRLDDESEGLDDYIGNYGVISNEAK